MQTKPPTYYFRVFVFDVMLINNIPILQGDSFQSLMQFLPQSCTVPYSPEYSRGIHCRSFSVQKCLFSDLHESIHLGFPRSRLQLLNSRSMPISTQVPPPCATQHESSLKVKSWGRAHYICATPLRDYCSSLLDVQCFKYCCFRDFAR